MCVCIYGVYGMMSEYMCVLCVFIYDVCHVHTRCEIVLSWEDSLPAFPLESGSVVYGCAHQGT